jgi:hypothetical protein
MSSLKIRKTGIFREGRLNSLNNVLLTNISDRLGSLCKEKAQESFLIQKKANPKLPSFIIESFRVEEAFASNSVKIVVYAGGPNSNAPWAWFVNMGFTTVGLNPRWVPGYYFMEDGLEAVNENKKKIITEEVNKLFGG